MSWLNFGKWTPRDFEFLAEAKARIGDVPFYDEQDPKYIPYSNDDYWLAPYIIIDPPKGVKEKAIRAAKSRPGISKSIRQRLEIERGLVCEDCKKIVYDHVHHKDGDPSNNDLGNLQLMCIKCHKRTHRGRRK